MAISTNTEALISLHEEKIANDIKQKEQIQYTQDGFTIDVPNGEPFKLYGITEVLQYYNEPVEKLDKAIYDYNQRIVGLQNTILDVGQSANDCGCGGFVGFTTLGVPFFVGINTITAYQDDLNYRGWSYTSPNPFSETSGTLTSVNAGIGTEDLIVQSSIGVYYGDVGVARTTLPVCPGVTNCTGYATSITNLSSQVSTLQSERNALIVKLNYMKSERSRYEIRQYGFESQKAALDAEIASSASLISFLQNPANEQWL
jgi:hypothetical protein